MHSEKFADRLKQLLADSKQSERAFARAIGLSPGGLRGLLHEGKGPTLETVLQIASACGVSVLWLSTGEGQPHAAKPDSTGGSPGTGRPPAGLDPELFGRVVDRVAKVYREANVRLPEVDKGRIAAERYPEIADQAESADEWPALLDLIEVRLKKALQTAVNAPGQTKREA
ncbi:helix-turn-helix domain-containing protein [Prosthecodimorpha staleyi]|uniref:Helix-turn-helix domain-containing protein n=1 Tax=Prosthecodimorpha staleyi TaxID=2840188 RepID=A0A947D7T9_9HYPH|nr:helix-turn-helix transcriptional regulator [Prosthecodimorpha staleyi]MBT9292693.1 helix-turn-helix domain-containing protein [Prosthecodimorpha staleyi]